MRVDQHKPTSPGKWRHGFCCGALRLMMVVGFGAVIWKAFTLQVVERSAWEERARAQTEIVVQVPIYRGSIYDRQGRLLAMSVPQRSLFADGEMVANPQKAANLLAPILQESAPAIQSKLTRTSKNNRQRRFIWLKRELTDQQANAVADLNVAGLHLIDEYRRFYPSRQIAGQLLGFVGSDGTGLEGVEKAYDQVLRERFQATGQQRDGLKKRLAFESKTVSTNQERPGLSLTVDSYLQYLAERELEEAVKKYRAKSGEVVVLDTRTFEVLAMANWPAFNPNNYRQEVADTWRNRSITDLFEPGSTFKVFLVAGAIEEKTVSTTDRIYCENGKYRLASHTINDVHPYGWLTIPDLIKHSSNIGASKIAVQLGQERYHRYIRGFGFGAKTGIDLPAEAKGAVRHWKRWRPVDLAAAGFGQSIGVTTLQLTAAVASIANGGVWMQPILAQGFLDQSGQWSPAHDSRTSRQVVRKKTAGQVRDMMVEVTKPGGTGVQAAINGFAVAGKTGTAQMLDPGSKRYSSTRYISIFTGFAPADNPRIAISVVIHEPHGAIYGGVVAAPVFHDIAAQALPYLGAAPADDGLTPGSCVPNLLKATPSVKPVAIHYTSGDAKARPMTAPNLSAGCYPPGQSDTDPAAMPNVVGLSFRSALQQLQHLQGRIQMEGSGQVVGQFPLPGTHITPGEVIELVLEPMNQPVPKKDEQS